MLSVFILFLFRYFTYSPTIYEKKEIKDRSKPSRNWIELSPTEIKLRLCITSLLKFYSRKKTSYAKPHTVPRNPL